MSAAGFVGAGDTPVPHANPHTPAGAMFPLFQSTAGVGVRLGAAGSAMVSCGVCLSVSTTSPFSFLPVCLSPKELPLNPWRRSKYGEATMDKGHGLGGIFSLHGPLQPHSGEIPWEIPPCCFFSCCLLPPLHPTSLVLQGGGGSGN